MKIISSALHGLVDFLISLALLILPFIFLKTGSVAAVFSVIAAVLQFLLAMATKYRAGIFKFLSFRTHGFIELGFACTMAIIALEYLSTGLRGVFIYYLSFTVIYCGLFLFTDFRVPEADKKPIVFKKRSA